MRAWEVQGSSGLENLAIAERPEPTPGPGEVVVEVRACSLNYRDLQVVQGLYDPKMQLPRGRSPTEPTRSSQSGRA